MRILRNSQLVRIMGSVLVVLVGFCLAPSLGVAWVEMADGVGVVQGDPVDGLGSCDSEGDPVDGLDSIAIWQMGDPGDGLALQGDPRDGLDYFRILFESGNFVLGQRVTPFFGYFRIP